jgi:hypothetical protein
MKVVVLGISMPKWMWLALLDRLPKVSGFITSTDATLGRLGAVDSWRLLNTGLFTYTPPSQGVVHAEINQIGVPWCLKKSHS